MRRGSAEKFGQVRDCRVGSAVFIGNFSHVVPAAMSILVEPAEDHHVITMAQIRARRWETEAFWIDRIGRYLKGEHYPQHALAARAAFVATDDEKIVGFVAGHRTRRHGCDGELEWIDVAEEQRRQGIAGKLIVKIADWFVEHKAVRICVDVDPANAVARALYAKHGAQELNPHWMVWPDATLMGKRSG
jgi:GNAT superfamily N-acetyltransferase